VLFIAAGFSIPGCSLIVNGQSVTGSGTIIEEQRDVSEFKRVHLKGSGKVFLRQADTQTLKIKTDDNIMPLIETDVNGSKLTVSQGRHHLRPTKFEVFIEVVSLEGISVSGSGEVKGEGRFVANTFYTGISGSAEIELEVETGQLSSNISGSGYAHLAGRAEDFTISVSGSGEIDAFDLQAEKVSIKISGSSDCRVNASESLNATISGSGDVYYRGRPKITTRISGSGSLESRDEK
jgi:hypothetical protein